MSNKKTRRRTQKRVSGAVASPAEGDLLGTLGRARAETARLVRALEAHREQTEILLKEINRQELDTGRLLRGIAEILDAFDRLVEENEGADVESYRASIRRTNGLLVEVLCNNSVMELIGRPGEIADPATHRVIEVRDENQPEDSVIRVVERGIRYRGELIRPASVIVSSGKEKQS